MQTKPFLVKTQYNREEHPCNYEENNKPSLTIPDQTLTIRQIIDRYTRGLPISTSMQNPIFQEDEVFNDVPDVNRLDLHDRMEFANNARQELEDIKNKLNAKKYPKKTVPPAGAEGENQGGDEGRIPPPSEAYGQELPIKKDLEKV